MVTKGKDLREGHKLRGHGFGPWRISKTVRTEAVHLVDAFTGKPFLDRKTGLPDYINTNRLMRFSGEIEKMENQEEAASLDTVQVGSWVAYVEGSEVYLLQVEEIEEDQWYQGRTLRVPTLEQHGGWDRRPWLPTEGEPMTRVMLKDALCQVSLDKDQCLDATSRERLEALGVPLR